jgi:hypothetical protein
MCHFTWGNRPHRMWTSLHTSLFHDYHSIRDPHDLHKLIKRQLLNKIKIQHVNISINGVKKKILFTIMQHINWLMHVFCR